ncbi:hypothetical protein SUDANB95_07941 (plasmid) [Actinosynnema sp. ALI-1.44]
MITKKSASRLLAVLTFGALALVGCTSNATLKGPDKPLLSAGPSGSSAPSETVQAQGQQDAAIKLGDLDTPVDAKSVGAPFDPCALGWSAFPAPVRPQEDKKPRLRAPGEKDSFATACRYDNGEKIEVTVDQNGQGSSKVGKNFITTVYWAQPGKMSLADANREGAADVTFGGKPGLSKAYTNSVSGEPACATLVTLANGTAGVNVTNGRFTAVDTCEIAKSVTEAIAAKAP